MEKREVYGRMYFFEKEFHFYEQKFQESYIEVTRLQQKNNDNNQ
jgi:hypothetical protein